MLISVEGFASEALITVMDVMRTVIFDGGYKVSRALTNYQRVSWGERSYYSSNLLTMS